MTFILTSFLSDIQRIHRQDHGMSFSIPMDTQLKFKVHQTFIFDVLDVMSVYGSCVQRDFAFLLLSFNLSGIIVDKKQVRQYLLVV